MNKYELVQMVAKQTQKTQKEILDVLETAVVLIQQEVSRGKKVTLVGFGTFESRILVARKARNPLTGETISVPEKIIPVFTAGKGFKQQVNKQP